MASAQVIKITTSDGQNFELEPKICNPSKKLSSAISSNKFIITLENTPSSVFERILAYLLYHAEKKDTQEWDDQYIKKFTGTELVNLIWSANYLEIPSLLKLSRERMIHIIENNDVNTMRNILNEKADFTKEEEDVISKTLNW